ncbi:MAG: CocE/NonD family hydrolase, partial [Anaerolineales bacterium]|nr:CocE/NonD family hydrolase [Anaerolineales bacterium]
FHQALIGPWIHNQPSSLAGEVDFGMRASPQLALPEMRQLDWFDYWLKDKDNGVDEKYPLQIFVMGRNRWRNEKEWPLARTRFEKFYLHSDGQANSLAGDGLLLQTAPADEAFDSYVHDPHNPVPTCGGPLCCWMGLFPGAYDQREVEKRPDVLVYSTGRLEQDLEVTGPVEVHLWAATSAEDTVYTAKLVDVSPDGYARNVLDGIIRTGHWLSKDRFVPVKPGSVHEYVIDLGATSNVFLAGHCIRLEISSSNFPRFDHNLNAAGHPRDVLEKCARQQIFHNTNRASYILLPVIPV